MVTVLSYWHGDGVNLVLIASHSWVSSLKNALYVPLVAIPNLQAAAQGLGRSKLHQRKYDVTKLNTYTKTIAAST